MAILGTGIDIVENYRLKEILLKKKSNFKKKYSLLMRLHIVKKNQMQQVVTLKDLLRKKLLLKL